ncbi:MAG TPA: hydroxyacid dehydrogenase [Longimicrobiales bacterium]
MTFYETSEAWEREALEADLAGQALTFLTEPLTPDTVDRSGDPEVLSVFIRSRVDADVLERLPALRMIATRSTGYDHIDLAACRERGITVSNVPHYGENTVAEHTFGLILSLARKICRATNRTRACDFSLVGLEGFDLRGRTLGVIGAGSIGLHVIRIARAFDMQVLAHDVDPHPILAGVLGFRYLPLDDVLGGADVVSLHVPLVPETHHLMNRERFALMRRGALLINTARGAVVDTEALIEALDEGIVGGAALDVLEGEELLGEEHHLFRTPPSEARLRELWCGHVLLDRDDVIITPHMAWYSRDARRRILETTIANIQAFLEGAPINQVAPVPAGRRAAA